MHHEIPIKVTAWVDEGVAPLVVALNEFDGVITLDSCEGGERGAYVLFTHRRDSADFAARLARSLGDSTEYLLQLEWRPSGEGDPLVALSCPRELVGGLADALNACRTRLSGDGNRDREPRSCSGHHRHQPAPTGRGGTEPSLA